MRVDGTPGDVFMRWSGGKLQFINGNDNSVILAIDPVNGQTELHQTEIVGQFFLPSGEVLASATEINDAGRFSGYSRVSAATLAGAAAADDIVFAWENPEDSAVIVYRVIVDITTAGGTAGALIDIGSAADAVTGSDDLIDGANANAEAAYDNLDDQGTNGKSKQKVPIGEFITGQIKIEKAEALEGTAYIYYTTA
jgi:hypothetical protein